MKAVMISIRPKWCESIANGKKTIEVRKTKPNIETSFKCYIYCTAIKDKKRYSDEFDIPINTKKWCGNGKVIGEFVCDDIDKIFVHNDVVYCVSNTQPNKLKQMCLSVEELKDYLVVNPNIASTLNAVDTNTGYDWHITDLKIYDEPKEIGGFNAVMTDKSIKCKYKKKPYNPYGRQLAMCELQNCYCEYSKLGYQTNCEVYEPMKEFYKLIKPPQSWCYCEELEENENE